MYRKPLLTNLGYRKKRGAKVLNHCRPIVSSHILPFFNVESVKRKGIFVKKYFVEKVFRVYIFQQFNSLSSQVIEK